MAEGPAREREISCGAARKDGERFFGIRAAHQPVDAEVTREPEGPQLVVTPDRYDFHPDFRADVPNGARQRQQRRGVGADILETDMGEPERPNVLDQFDRVGDRGVIARQHEDEVHSVCRAPIAR